MIIGLTRAGCEERNEKVNSWELLPRHVNTAEVNSLMERCVSFRLFTSQNVYKQIAFRRNKNWGNRFLLPVVSARLSLWLVSFQMIITTTWMGRKMIWRQCAKSELLYSTWTNQKIKMNEQHFCKVLQFNKFIHGH